MSEYSLIALAGIGLLSIACQWFAWLVKLPAILFLLLTGVVAGPLTGWLEPDLLFGELLFPFVSLSVAVILFEGSLTLKFDQIRGLTKVVRNMVTVGMLTTWLVISIACYSFLAFPFELALLFGAVTVVTGPTVIIPMLRTVRPNARIANILRWEGIVIDPIGALLAVLVFEFIVSSGINQAISHTLLTFGQVIVIGVALGASAGHALGLILRHHLLPEYLHNMATLTLVFGVFALSNVLQAESGLLTVTVMGVWLANMRDVRVDDILGFKESLSLLLISGLFIILAARIEFNQIETLGWGALGILLVIQFVARPLKIFICTWGTNLSWQERALLSWIAPRGIVAAAVSALFAMQLQQKGYEQASLLVPMTFLVIIGTVVLQSSTSRFVAKKLGVAEPEPRGVLIIGANLVARKLAKAIEKHGFRALLTDSSWDNISAARMDGLNVYYGNPISEHADRHLELVGIGKMLGMSPQDDLNTLASLRYKREFGTNAVYSLPIKKKKSSTDKHIVADQHRGYTLFGEEVSYSKLASLVSKGADIHSTLLTREFGFDHYKEKYGKSAITLLAIDNKDRLRVFHAEGQIKPEAGWNIISLINKEAKESKEPMDENISPLEP